ncbi:MAG: hypothetical protein IKA84_01720 [Clostridia bacterium]|nr:hypothetical protein [Clostridia bacterium]
MKKLVILFVALLLVSVISMSSLISVYAYCDEENTTTDETNVATEEENSAYSSRSSIIEGGGEINGELWYGIELDTEGKPIITYDIDYSDSHLLEYLKPGDIVYERNAGLDVVDFLGHIAMVVEVVPETPTQRGYVLMIESLPNTDNPYTGEPRELGVCYSIMTPTRFDVKHVSIMRVKNATDTQIEGAINWAVSRLGKAWRVPANKFINNEKNWYCSELVWAAYCLQDIDLVENNILPVPPKDIYESNEVATILDYRADTEDYYDTDFINKTDTHHTYSCDGDTYTEEHDYEVYNYCYEKCRACGYERQAKEHDYSYTTVSSSVHEATCTDCGYTEEKPHTFRYTSRNATQHTKVCIDCDESITENHNYEGKIIDATEHSLECDCGATNGTQGHIWTSSGIGKVKCDFCGFIKILAPGEFIPIIKNKEDLEEETE